MSIRTSRTRLLTSLKDLKLRWDAVRRDWNDPVGRAFEEEYVAPLERHVRSSVTAIEHMSELLTRARRDCE